VLETEKVTSIIPIVFALASDPLGTGMVASLARPGGNATGLSLQSPDLAGKRLEQLRAAVPAVHRLAVLANVSYRAALLEMDDVKTTVAKTGLETVDMAIRRPEDIEPAFKAVKGRVDAIYVCGSEALVNNNRVRIATLALGARLPTLYPEKQYVKAGGVMSYGATIPNMFRRAAEIVDKILHGANPADIPVEQPTKFELVVNLKTANSLGLTVPPTLLALADEVIE